MAVIIPAKTSLLKSWRVYFFSQAVMGINLETQLEVSELRRGMYKLKHPIKIEITYYLGTLVLGIDR